MSREEEILAAALALPDTARATLADRLLQSLDDADQLDLDALWGQEAEARIAAFERGEIEAIPGEDVSST